MQPWNKRLMLQHAKYLDGNKVAAPNDDISPLQIRHSYLADRCRLAGVSELPKTAHSTEMS